MTCFNPYPARTSMISYPALGPYDLDPHKVYGISDHYTGRGLASEAAAAVLSYGFEVLELDEIITTAYPQNLRKSGHGESLLLARPSRRA